MKNTIIAIALVIGLASCQKEGYVYKHNYKYSPTQEFWSSGTFVVDHVLSSEEENAWRVDLDRKVIEQGASPTGRIDTSYVQYVSEVKNF